MNTNLVIQRFPMAASSGNNSAYPAPRTVSLATAPDYPGPQSRVSHVACEHLMNTASKFLH